MRILVLIALLFCGCATVQPPEAPDTLPELIYQAPLPPWPTTNYIPGLTLELMVRVSSDGSVYRAALLTPSGDDDWDSLALATIHQWRFSPARVGTTQVPCWIRQKVRVQFEPAMPIVLSELACTDRTLIDSVYELLTQGAPFDSLARVFSVFTSRGKGGFLGQVDARAFPSHIRQKLANLRVGDITKPLVLGQNLVIYKRLGQVP
jgi:TonB family protein